MPEALNLTTPITVTRSGYTLLRLVLDWEASRIEAVVRGSDGVEVQGEWRGPAAVTMMTALNTADLRTNSLVKRVFTQLVAAGTLPAGTVTGTPT